MIKTTLEPTSIESPTKTREYKKGVDPCIRKLKYNSSDKGKETSSKYSRSENRMTGKEKYNGSDKGRTTTAEHAQSEDRIASKVKYNLSLKADWQKRAYEDSVQGISRRLTYEESARAKQSRKTYEDSMQGINRRRTYEESAKAKQTRKTYASGIRKLYNNANNGSLMIVSNLIEKNLKSLDTYESEIKAVDVNLKATIEDDLHRHMSGLSLDECCCVVCDALSLSKTCITVNWDLGNNAQQEDTQRQQLLVAMHECLKSPSPGSAGT